MDSIIRKFLVNQAKPFLCLGGITLFLLIIGDWIANESGFLVALVLSIFMVINAVFFAGISILKLFHAKKLNADSSNNIISMVTTLSEKAKVKMPDVYLIDSVALNGFSVQLNHHSSAIVLTTALSTSNDERIKKIVISYAISRIQERCGLMDNVAENIAYSIFSFFSIGAWKRVLGINSNPEEESPERIGKIIMGPVAAFFVNILIPRNRVFQTDKKAIRLSGHSADYEKVLQELQAVHEATPFLEADMYPSTAHLFVINPLKSPQLVRLFNRFPTVDERVEKLKTTNESRKSATI